MTTLVETEKGNCLLIKGASEYILNSCDQIHFWEGNEVKPLTNELKNEIKQNILGFAKKTLRTLILAYKYVPEDFQPNEDQNA